MLLPALVLAMIDSPQVNPTPDGQAVAAMQSFSRDLVGALPTAAGANLVFSPFSIGECLALLLPGVGADAAGAISKTLHLPSDTATAVEGIRTLNSRFSDTPNGEFVLANSLWTGPGYHLSDAYRNVVQQKFGALAATLPDTGAAGVQAVNGWIADKTKGRIPNLVQRLDASTSAMLVNAVSFDGKWRHPFKAGLTADQPFHVSSGEASVPTMAQTGMLPYFAGAGYRAVSLPYASGGFAMWVLLPDPGTDPLSLLRGLDIASLPAASGAFVDLRIPKFKFNSRFDLLGMLGRLGLGSLTSGFDASHMLGTRKQMQITAMVHGAEIEVDENGTRATGATAIGISPTAILHRPEPVVFHVDRPFAFMIVHGPTQTPLFVGAVYNPGR